MAVVHDARLAQMLNADLTCEEHELFCMHFRAYLRHDPDKDFVIDLDDVYKWLGYSRVDHAKRVLVSQVREGTEWCKCLLPKAGEQRVRTDAEQEKGRQSGDNRGGHNKERILLTVNGFKQLCMAAHTEKASRVRNYYISMEAVMFRYLRTIAGEQQQALANVTAQRDALQNVLELERDEMQRKLSQRFANAKKNQVVYIYKNGSDPTSTLYNVGQTANVARREAEYRTHNFDGRFLYSRPCYDCVLLEKVVHHMLDQYRVVRGREWFDAPYEHIQEVLDTAQLFLDSFVNNADRICASGAAAQIRDILRSTPGPMPSGSLTDAGHTTRVETSCIDSTDQEETADTSTEADASTDILPQTARDPLDFQRFIDECCVMDPDGYAFSAEVLGCHKIWSRNIGKSMQNALRKHMKASFREAKKLDAATGAMLNAYVGIRLIPPEQIVVTESTCDVDRFVSGECRIEYVGRVSTRAFVDAFAAWKRASDNAQDYVICPSERRRIEHVLSQRFLLGSVFTGEHAEIGFFGLSLGGDPRDVGLKLNPKLKKKVWAIDVATRKVAHVFDSLNACAAHFNTTPSSVSQDIRFNRLRGNPPMYLTYTPCSSVDWAAPLSSAASAPKRPKLPLGVHYVSMAPDSKFKTMICHKGVTYSLGTYATVAAAQQVYAHAKQLVDTENGGGPAADAELASMAKHRR